MAKRYGAERKWRDEHYVPAKVKEHLQISVGSSACMHLANITFVLMGDVTTGEAIHYRTGLVCRVSNTLGKCPFALGKGFAECGTRQTTLGKKSDGEGTFAECLFSGTRQSLCRVSKGSRQIFRSRI